MARPKIDANLSTGILTVANVAELLSVSAKNVKTWILNNNVKYFTPIGSVKQIRVSARSLVDQMRKSGMPIPDILIQAAVNYDRNFTRTSPQRTNENSDNNNRQADQLKTTKLQTQNIPPIANTQPIINSNPALQRKISKAIEQSNNDATIQSDLLAESAKTQQRQLTDIASSSEQQLDEFTEPNTTPSAPDDDDQPISISIVNKVTTEVEIEKPIPQHIKAVQSVEEATNLYSSPVADDEDEEGLLVASTQQSNRTGVNVGVGLADEEDIMDDVSPTEQKQLKKQKDSVTQNQQTNQPDNSVNDNNSNDNDQDPSTLDNESDYY